MQMQLRRASSSSLDSPTPDCTQQLHQPPEPRHKHGPRKACTLPHQTLIPPQTSSPARGSLQQRGTGVAHALTALLQGPFAGLQAGRA